LYFINQLYLQLKMAKKLKVFGGTIFYGTPRKQVRVLVAAYTKKQAVELLSTVSIIRYHEFNDYFSETGNDTELSIAIEVGMWVKTNDEVYNKPENYTKL
jgi:ketopantoate reductase